MKRTPILAVLLIVFTASAASAQVRTPRPPVAQRPPGTIGNDQPDGKGTIGMVCIDLAGRQVTWQQSGPEHGYDFENCVSAVMHKASDELIAQRPVSAQQLRLDLRLDSVIRGLELFQSVTEQVCRDKQIELDLFY